MNTIFIIVFAVVIIALCCLVYLKLNNKGRIAIILLLQFAVGGIGALVWKNYNFSLLPVLAVIVTIGFGILIGIQNAQIIGMLFLIVMFAIIVITGMSSVNQNGGTNIEKSKITLYHDSSETSTLNEQQIRETKEPVLISGYKHFYQNQFPDVYWTGGSGQSLPYNGCSVVAMTDILANFGVDETPETIVNYLNSLPDNYHKSSGGARYEMFYDLAIHYNMPGTCVPEVSRDDLEQVTNCLAFGGMIISLQGAGEFTKNGHYIVICDLHEDGTVLVLDPNLSNRERQESKDFRYTLEEVSESCIYWWLFYQDELSI